MSSLFISYARTDSAQALRFYTDLRAAGHRPWIDQRDLKPGNHVDQCIEAAIVQSRYFVPLMSSTSLSKRGYFHKEMRIALRVLEHYPIGDRFLLPVRLDPCIPKHPRIAEVNWVDFFPRYREGLDRFLEGIAVEDLAITSMYSEAGISVPADIGSWPDDRLFSYIESELAEEALQRSRRDWQGMPEADDARLLLLRAEEKIEAVALEKGFVGGWRRYQAARLSSGAS